ncbi:MAG: hypothetical protein ACYTEW_23535 [Planctomycetota bacterium]|jgi:hypothetical protein
MMPKTKKMTPNQKIILILMSITALCLFALFVALIPSVYPTAPSPPPAAPTPLPVNVVPPVPTPLKHRAGGAILQCRQFIRDRLVSPSSAKFSREKPYRVNDEPMNYHAVVGIVESQNRFGVLLRSEYRCDTHYLVDDPNEWVLDYLDIED